MRPDRLTTATLIALAATALAFASSPPPARADADPASDVLLTQNAFYYSPPVSPGVGQALTAVANEAAQAGFPVKVATVPAVQDMGGVPDLFDQAPRYATFLASEISFNRKQLVLVVMPSGFGTANIDPAVAKAISGLTVDRTSADSLTRSAITAVLKLSAAAKHPLKAPRVAGGSSGGGGTSAIVYAAPLILVLLAAGATALLRSRSAVEDDDDEEDGEGEGEEGGEGARS